MALVLGVDSSTQSTKALLVDADDGTVVAARVGAAPAGHRGGSAGLAGRGRRRPAHGLLERADAVAVGGQQHGMVALDDDGEPVRDALLWNDTRSAPEAAALIAGARRPAGLRRRDRQRAGRVVHGHQAALAARPRAGPGRAGGRGAAPARLRRPPPVRPRHRGVHRPRRRLRHRLLRDRRGHLAPRPGQGRARPRAAAAAGRGARRRRRADRRPADRSAPAPATTWPPPWVWTCRPATC